MQSEKHSGFISWPLEANNLCSEVQLTLRCEWHTLPKESQQQSASCLPQIDVVGEKTINNHSCCPLSWDNHHQRAYDYCKAISAAARHVTASWLGRGWTKQSGAGRCFVCECVDLLNCGGLSVWASTAVKTPRRIHNNAATTGPEEPRKADMVALEDRRQRNKRSK